MAHTGFRSVAQSLSTTLPLVYMKFRLEEIRKHLLKCFQFIEKFYEVKEATRTATKPNGTTPTTSASASPVAARAAAQKGGGGGGAGPGGGGGDAMDGGPAGPGAPAGGGNEAYNSSTSLQQVRRHGRFKILQK